MAVQIQSFKRVVPMIYAYNTPGVVYHDGWTKIGYTEKQTPAQRVKQQTHTADIRHVGEAADPHGGHPPCPGLAGQCHV